MSGDKARPLTSDLAARGARALRAPPSTRSASGTARLRLCLFLQDARRGLFRAWPDSAPTIRSLIVTSPLAFSSEPWMNDARTSCGGRHICICGCESCRIAEIKLGADAGVAQRSPPCCVVIDRRYRDHLSNTVTTTGPTLGLGFDLADIFQRREQPRHADGKSRRRHRLAAKARHEAVVTSAAADRAEARRAVLAVGRECQFNFEHRRRCNIRDRELRSKFEAGSRSAP